MTKRDTVIKRTEQPKCANCHHPKSFHGGGETECRALGCVGCKKWVEPDEESEKVAALPS